MINPMETIHNFRDVGGLTAQNGSALKEGLLFRSGSLANASSNDLKKLSLLEIKTVCDLRSHAEMARAPDRIPNVSKISYVHIPMQAIRDGANRSFTQLFSFLFGSERKLDYAKVSEETYQVYVSEFNAELSTLLYLATDRSNLPMLIHCTAGKDRTGIACGLIQSALGVPLELVMQDYLRSNDYLQSFYEVLHDRYRYLSLLGVSWERFLPLFEARWEYLEAAFRRIEQDYGTVANYFRDGLNFSDDDQKRLGNIFLEN